MLPVAPHDYGMLRDDDLLMLLPSQWMQRHNHYYSQPATRAFFPNLQRQEDANREKLEDDDDDEDFNKRFPSHMRHWRRFVSHEGKQRKIEKSNTSDERKKHIANPNIPDEWKKRTANIYNSDEWKNHCARLLQFRKDSIADAKRVMIPFYTVNKNIDDGLPIDGKCRMCLKEAHINYRCPYQDFCPIGTQIGDGYFIACKHCHKVLSSNESSCCARQEGYAKARTRFKRGP